MGIKRYCVFGCKGLYYTPMHQFPNPMKSPEVFAAWMSTVGDRLKDQNPMQIYKHKRICDRHFGPTQKRGKNRVIQNAVPSVNLKCVVQSIVDIVETDHNYSSQRRELQQMPVEFIKKIYSSTSDLETTSIPYLNSRTVKSAKKVNTAKEDSVKQQTISVAKDHPHVDNIDDYDDEIVVETLVPESDESPHDLFSWEKTDTIVADDTMIVSDFTTEASDLTTGFEDISMYKDEQPFKDDHDQRGSETLDYLCNGCGEKITGFRYTCVQCADWDLCAACEARAAHDSHYMLRVPAQRPYKEVQTLLTAVRQQLLSETLFLTELTTGIKQELIDEDAEVPEGAPDPEGDPLGAWNIQRDDHFHPLVNNFEPNKDTHLPQIKNIDKQKITRKKSGQDGPNGSNMYTDIIQITKENDLNMLSGRLAFDMFNMSKSKQSILQHTDQQNLVDMTIDETPLESIKQESDSSETHNEEIIIQDKDIGMQETAQSEGKETLGHAKTGTHRGRIMKRNIATINNRIKKHYKILLPPGDQWTRLLMTMLKSQLTVQLEDVIRKKGMQKKPEKNKKTEINL